MRPAARTRTRASSSTCQGQRFHGVRKSAGAKALPSWTTSQVVTDLGRRGPTSSSISRRAESCVQRACSQGASGPRSLPPGIIPHGPSSRAVADQKAAAATAAASAPMETARRVMRPSRAGANG